MASQIIRYLSLFCIIFLFENSIYASKKNICSITINSNNEINAFRKSLPSDKFNFYELTSADIKNWFENSCARHIQCDVLVLSGHFATQFFGDKGLNLTTLQLEEKSCLKACPGVTHSPKEVFLFGCNTLADKKPDHRTPEQYMQILISDGFQESTARTIAMARYSPIDHSFRQRMSHVFHNSPIVYGFSATGPKGVYAEKPVLNFIKEVGDYSRHLDRLSSQDTETIKQELGKSEKLWKKHFAIYNGTIETNIEESKDEVELVCQANDYSRNKKNALVSLEKLLRNKNRLAYLLLAEKILRNLTYSMLNIDERNALEIIKSNINFRNEVISGFNHLSYNIELSLKIIRMMNSLGWLTKEEHDSITNETLGRFLTQSNLKNSDYDIICDSGFWHPDFSYNFTQQQLENHKLIQVFSCLRVKNQKLIKQLQQLYLAPHISSAVKTEIYIFLYRLGLMQF